MNRIYYRNTIAALPPAADGSEKYSRAFAQSVFDRSPGIHTLEYVVTGRKTDSAYCGRGTLPPPGVFVRVASTGGTWGKSARSFANYAIK